MLAADSEKVNLWFLSSAFFDLKSNYYYLPNKVYLKKCLLQNSADHKKNSSFKSTIFCHNLSKSLRWDIYKVYRATFFSSP